MNGKCARYSGVPVKFHRMVLCLSQSILLTFGNTLVPGYAANGTLAATDQAHLEQLEKVLFGQTRGAFSTESRLRTLEANLFGAHQHGSVHSRLENASKALGGGRTNLLLPPLAPQLDTSNKGIPSHLSSSQAADFGTLTALDSGSAYDKQSYDTAELNNDNVKSMLQDAIRLSAAGRANEAESAFKRVLELDDKNIDAHFSLGVMAEAKGDLSLALSHYKAAASFSPSDSELKDAIASVQNKLREKIAAGRARAAEEQQAYADARQTQQRDQFRKIISEASSAYKSGNFDRAIELLQTIAPQVPHDGDLQYALGQAYRGKGDLQQARTAFRHALAINPQSQLYRRALDEVDERITQNGSYADSVASGNNGFCSKHLTQYAKDAPARRTMPFNNRSDIAYQPTSMPAGQIVPFSGSAITSWPLGRSDWRGGVSIGGRSLSGTRLKRAVIGGMTGAAIGALMGSIGGGGVRGSIKNGAVRGGILGAVFGLMSGY